MKKLIKRTAISFTISCFAGLIVNLLIDLGVNASGVIENFISISPAFAQRFPTPAMAAYVNILLYGVIGATFSAMGFVFEIDRLGFLIQYLIYFCSTSVVLAFITIYLWELQKIPVAMVCTIAGYGLSFVIMGIVQYRMVRQDIDQINELIGESTIVQS